MLKGHAERCKSWLLLFTSKFFQGRDERLPLLVDPPLLGKGLSAEPVPEHCFFLKNVRHLHRVIRAAHVVQHTGHGHGHKPATGLDRRTEEAAFRAPLPLKVEPLGKLGKSVVGTHLVRVARRDGKVPGTVGPLGDGGTELGPWNNVLHCQLL